MGDAESTYDAQLVAIIDMLREDGRRSYSSIAKAVGLSEAAVRQRVQRLIDQGQMQIVALTNPLEELKLSSMLQIRACGRLRDIGAQISALPEVSFCAIVTGDYQIMVEAMCRDGEHLLTLVNETIDPMPGVIEVRTAVYLDMVKVTYQWGTWPLGRSQRGAR